jgi:hypothetical protein
MPLLLVLHLLRADNQTFRILLALQALLLYTQIAFFIRAPRKLGRSRAGGPLDSFGITLWPRRRLAGRHPQHIKLAAQEDGGHSRGPPVALQPAAARTLLRASCRLPAAAGAMVCMLKHVVLSMGSFLVMVLIIVGGSAMLLTTLMANSTVTADSTVMAGSTAETASKNHFSTPDSTLMQAFSFTMGGIDIGTLDNIRDQRGECMRLLECLALVQCLATCASIGAALFVDCLSTPC